MKNSDIYSKITEEILAIMEAGEIPWNKRWNGGANLPVNGVTGKQYNGTNCYLMLLPYASNEFFTFNQIQQLDGRIKKGEKGHYVVYWKTYTPKNADEDNESNEKEKAIPFLKHYVVWNREQCEGLPEANRIAPEIDPIEAGERIIEEYQDRPEITHGGDRACYIPSQDKILCPERSSFQAGEHYYSTLFHECVHSTGSQSRLNRNIRNTFGTEDYSKEELVAELGAAFLCGISGIANACTRQDSAAYIQNWIKVLKSDVKFFFDASRLAGKAVEYITNGKKCAM